MAPLLQKGIDAVIVESIPFRLVKADDIILFYDMCADRPTDVSNIVCHRVFSIDRKKGMLFEKGDNYFRGSNVSSDLFIGRVKIIIKAGHSYSVDENRNKLIIRLIGCLSRIFYFRTRLYLHIHKCTMDEIASDKNLRDAFFDGFRSLSRVLLKGLKEIS